MEEKIKSRIFTKEEKILNYKMHYAYRNVGKLDDEVKKMMDNVMDKCEICKKNGSSKSKPSVAVLR